MIRYTLPIALVLAFCGPALANTLFILVTRDGHPAPIQLMSMDRDQVGILIPGKGHLEFPREDCLALLRPEPRPVTRTRAQLHLRDGQIFIGHPSPSSSKDAIHWTHPWIGLLRVPIDQVDMMRLDADPVPQSTEGYDQVVLRNGDILRGFIASVDDGVEIELQRTTGTETTRIPWSRVSSLNLFGTHVPPTFPRAWFMDGTVASFKEINLGQDSWLTFSTHGHAIGVENMEPDPQPMREVHSIAVGGEFIHPLRIDPPANPGTRAPATRPHAPLPRATDPTAVLGLSPIEISGPISCSWDIPEGAVGFRTRAFLPASMQTWGNLQLVISVDGRVLSHTHLSADTPTTEIDVSISGKMLTIELIEEANGPVQDTIVLEYPMFLLSP